MTGATLGGAAATGGNDCGAGGTETTGTGTGIGAFLRLLGGLSAFDCVCFLLPGVDGWPERGVCKDNPRGNCVWLTCGELAVRIYGDCSDSGIPAELGI